MKPKKKNKEFLSGEKFLKGIKYWQKQIADLVNIKSTLKRYKAEAKKAPQKLKEKLETRTAIERMINKQLHQEIEHRRSLEEKLQVSETRFRRLFEAARDGILILDADTGHVVEVNQFLIDLLGYSHEEFLGKNIWDIGFFKNVKASKSAFKELQAKGYIRYEDLPLQTKDGRIIEVEFISNVYKVDSKKVIQCSIRDMTNHKKLEEKLRVLVSRDELTGCVNFRATMELLENEIARCQRYQKIFSIIMIDIDHFKRVNEKYGHMVGNDALVTFANVIKNSIRNIDVACRYGGEEFIIILPESDSRQALVVLERIKNNLAQTKIYSAHLEKVKHFRLKFSAGVVSFPHNAEDLKGLIWVADSALRQAKRKGKNRAVVERRQLIRFSPQSGTKIEIIDPSNKENSKALQIANISKGGMLLLSSRDIVDEELLCRIHCPKGQPPFELTCKVKHKGKSGSEFYRIGVYFPDIPEGIKEKISNCIESPKE